MRQEESPRVIVVDDEVTIAATLALILEKSGFSATHFTNPLDALQSVEIEAPDLLIPDVVMPTALRKTSPWMDRPRNRSPNSIDGERSSGARQFCRMATGFRGSPPLGEVQYPFERNGHAKDDAWVLVEGDLCVAPEALFRGEHLAGSGAVGLRQKDGSGPLCHRNK